MTARQEHEAATAAAVADHLRKLEVHAAKQDLLGGEGGQLAPAWSALARDVRAIIRTGRAAIDDGTPVDEIKARVEAQCADCVARERTLLQQEDTDCSTHLSRLTSTMLAHVERIEAEARIMPPGRRRDLLFDAATEGRQFAKEARRALADGALAFDIEARLEAQLVGMLQRFERRLTDAQ